jgi:tRNA-2-methylthio-N6-dimethylallyladenosine synthase
MTDSSPAAVFVETYGCQMNVLDSELVLDHLATTGYKAADSLDAADVVLLNTCSVRDLAEHKVWSRLGRLGLVKRAAKPKLVVGVIGCMAERELDAIKRRMPHVDLVCGPSRLSELPELLDSVRAGRGLQVAISGHTARRSTTLDTPNERLDTLDLARSYGPGPGSGQAYVRVTRGCNKLCSFCVVPYTRGPEVHRPPQQIIDEVRKLVDTGVVEVTLLGQTVNHYEHESTSFADLLWRVHESVPELGRLRFVTSYPRDFDDATLDVMASAERICRYLHLPAQSGSNRMLLAMNRGYTVEEYVALLERARSRMPDIRFAGDMIAGFPRESDDDHAASLELLRRARYKSCFVFKYSPRPGTVADRRFEDDVPEEVKKERNLELLALQAELSLAHNRALVGEQLEVLVESESKLRSHSGTGVVQIGDSSASSVDARRMVGRTRYDEIVAFDGPANLVGRSVRVRAVDATPITVLAELDQSQKAS